MFSVIWRSTYVEGFLVPIFDFMIFFRAFFEIHSWTALIDFVGGISASETCASWEPLGYIVIIEILLLFSKVKTSIKL